MNYYIKAVTTDGETELFNLDHIINMAPRANGTIKILMGAGLAWDVYPDTIEYIDCINDLMKELKGGFMYE